MLWLGGGTIGAIALAACGQATITEAPVEDAPEEKEAEAKEPEPQAEPVNLDWALWGDSTWVEAAQAGADVYTANNPNVTLNVLGVKDSPAVYITAWVAGSGPDIAMTWGTNLVQAGREGLLLNMDPFIKRDSFPMDDYIPFQLSAMRWPETGQYGLPMYINVYVLWYNKQVFEKKGMASPMTRGAGTNTKMRCSGLPTAPTPSLAAWTRAGAAAFGRSCKTAAPWSIRRTTATPPSIVLRPIEAMEWVHARYHRDRSMVHGEEWAALDRSKVQALMQARWQPGKKDLGGRGSTR